MQRTTLALMTLTAALWGCSPSSTGAPTSSPAQSRSSSPLDGAALVLDVRNQDEYDRGHLSQALLIPVAELETRIGEVESALGGDKSKKIVAYCGSGRRSGKAKELLEQHGFTNVVNGGGYDQLK